MLKVVRSDPAEPGATALLHQSHALMQSLFNPEENHFLSIEALQSPSIAFFTARQGEEILGTAALKNAHTYGEIKSMFVAEAARGKGVADALMRMLEDEARAQGLPMLRLETGNLLHAAHRLYARHGFTPCGPFGDYEAMPTSVFMEKPLP
ncbi:GNAT family N-acetyltransferase [Oceaniglobus roseus]|uniref:GNAT family N-acetyltransferase n=1 Tax=Oceaniglobus roseus TaxID=1737570 RepID=UPI003CCB9E60